MTELRPVDTTSFTVYNRALFLWQSTIVAGLLIFGGLFALSYFILSTSNEAMLGFTELAGLGISVIAFLRYLRVRTRFRWQALRQFLEDNNWSQINKYDIDKAASILLGAGAAYNELYAFSGNFIERCFSCLIYQYIATSSQTCRFICLRFKLSKAYPLIILDNKLNDHGYRRSDSNLPDRVPDGVRVSLEGDFDKYYRLSVTKGREQEAVHVLSPDLMAALIDQAYCKVDIEVSGKDLFLIYEDNFYSEQNINSLFSVAKTMIGKLDRLSETWLASSRWEERVMSKSARAARNKLLLSGYDLISAIIALCIFVFITILMISSTHQ